MDVAGLLTSAGINVGLCGVLFSLYSVLRKQPSNRIVYFGRRVASFRCSQSDTFFLERFVPSPSWIVKSWDTTEDEILGVGGLDALVFQRMLIFSIRIFSIAALVCNLIVVPVNYYGKDMLHRQIPSESLEVFTIGNVQQGSKWLWVHCVALYIVSCSACFLLYYEYRRITKMRLAHLSRSPPNPSHFTLLVRSIPRFQGESYNDSVDKFFKHYYASSYLSHQMVYRCGLMHKLMGDAEKMCIALKDVPTNSRIFQSQCMRGGRTDSLKMSNTESGRVDESASLSKLNLTKRENECAAAFIFFKTRYAALAATQMLQSTNPMLWVTELAPEPQDILWSKLSVPYRQLWLRRIATLLASIAFMLVFLIPVTFVQGLTQLDALSRAFPFLRGLLKKDFMNNIITGYLPSVILMLFLFTVPPTMMLFSSVEGPISRSGRKKSACVKILYFTIWNVLFVNVFSGSIIRQLNVFTSVKDIPMQLAKAVPAQATFFMTYVLTSGWTSLACELMQLFPLLWNFIKKFILRKREDSSNNLVSFPYHTEVPRVLLFGLLGFTCSVLAPLILPLLLIYFILAYLIYRNQIVNVYASKYETGGKYWPIAHNTTIFSLVLTQIIALGVFGIKESPVASGFTIPLVICTLLFNEYCRRRFYPIFKKDPAQVLIEMDRRDEQSGQLGDIYQQVQSAYSQFPLNSEESCKLVDHPDEKGEKNEAQDPEDVEPGNVPSDTSNVNSDTQDVPSSRADDTLQNIHLDQ